MQRKYFLHAGDFRRVQQKLPSWVDLDRCNLSGGKCFNGSIATQLTVCHQNIDHSVEIEEEGNEIKHQLYPAFCHAVR